MLATRLFRLRSNRPLINTGLGGRNYYHPTPSRLPQTNYLPQSTTAEPTWTSRIFWKKNGTPRSIWVGFHYVMVLACGAYWAMEIYVGRQNKQLSYLGSLILLQHLDNSYSSYDFDKDEDRKTYLNKLLDCFRSESGEEPSDLKPDEKEILEVEQELKNGKGDSNAFLREHFAEIHDILERGNKAGSECDLQIGREAVDALVRMIKRNNARIAVTERNQKSTPPA